MALFLPQRWTRQPPYPARIDRSNPLTRGLQIAAYPIGGVMWDGVHGVVSTPVSAPTVAYRAPDMMAAQTNGTSSYQSFSLTPFGIDKSAGITLAMWEDVDVSSSVTYNNGLGVVCTGGVTYTNSAHGYLQPYYNAGATPQRGLQLVVPKSSDGSIQGSVGALTSGQLVGLQLYAVSSKYTAATTQAYWNGIPLAMTEAFTWAGTTWGTTVTELRVGGLVLQDTSYYGPTKAVLALYWVRALTDSEHAQLARNPWALFEPHQPRIFLSVSASGEAAGTFTGTSVASFVGAATAASVLSASASASMVGVGASIAAAVFGMSGAADLAGTGSYSSGGITSSGGSFTGTASASFVGASTAAGAFAMTGTATVSYVGRALGASIWTPADIATSTWTPQSSSSTTWTQV